MENCKEKNGKREKKVEKSLKLRVININGLTPDKYIEIEEEFYTKEEINITCLTETHEKYEKIEPDRNITTFNVIREKKTDEKRGGGIQVMIPKMTRIDLKKIENINKELLELEGTVFGIGLKIIIVYFDANRNQKGKDRNSALRKIIEEKIENNKKEGIIVAGDFNGHMKEIDGRDTDKNGKMITDWMEEYSLITLNLEERCEGTYTRIQGETKTTIDYVMVNRKIYENFEKMHIDEEKEIIEGSDHNLITVNLRFKDKNIFKKTKWLTNEYYTTKELEVNRFVEKLGKRWKDKEEKDLDGALKAMMEEADKELKRTSKRRVGGEEGNKKVERIWMTDRIRNEIKEKKIK